ncbi:MAG TPA: class I SAM-dependent methyltransferase, partial [Gammaproteobacteria bacterium]|nr:class I SAM-dependent methyltransferase [Gammaproteobacteria bacterium]
MEPYKRIREIYGKAAIDYDKFWDFYSAPSYSKTLARINLEEGSKVLDLGCGTGELLKILEDCFPSSDLTGIDLTEEMLAIAKQKLSSRVELLLGSVTNLPFDSE